MNHRSGGMGAVQTSDKLTRFALTNIEHVHEPHLEKSMSDETTNEIWRENEQVVLFNSHIYSYVSGAAFCHRT
jgi:hypothetical protein